MPPAWIWVGLPLDEDQIKRTTNILPVKTQSRFGLFSLDLNESNEALLKFVCHKTYNSIIDYRIVGFVIYNFYYKT